MSAGVHDEVAARLAESDQRYTSGRRRLVDVMVETGRPVTLPEIVAAAPDIPQSSAYRNLDVLEECGVVRRINGSGDHQHFELAEPLLHHHHHLICLACGAVIDVHLPDELEAAVTHGLATEAAKMSFTPVHHSLDLHGYCQECSNP